MMILKTNKFNYASDLVEFVIKNNIARENIIAITSGGDGIKSADNFIFFYGDSNVKELTNGLFGWS